MGFLSLAHDIARNGISTAARDASIAVRNIARVDDPDAARKTLQRTTMFGGGVVVTGVERAVDKALGDRLLDVGASSAASAVVLDGYDRLSRQLGGLEEGRSPAALLSELRDSLQLFANNPGDALGAQNAIANAEQLSNALNAGAATVVDLRREADVEIERSVALLEQYLGDFEVANREVVQGTALGRDVTDQLDQRDALARKIGELVHIRADTRENNDAVLFLSSGVTLFDRQVRDVHFNASASLGSGLDGSPVWIDGVPVGTDNPLAVPGGKIGGLMHVRDSVALDHRRQLDEIAFGLIGIFAETSVSGGPDATGLFTYSGSPALPAASTGLAAEIALAPSFDVGSGGDPFLLRDGGANGAAYVVNAAGGAGYSERLIDIIDAVGGQKMFGAASGLGVGLSLFEVASATSAWVESGRKAASERSESDAVLYDRTHTAFVDGVGVNLDDQLARLIEVEQSYQASARLLTTIDRMFAAVLQVAS